MARLACLALVACGCGATDAPTTGMGGSSAAGTGGTTADGGGAGSGGAAGSGGVAGDGGAAGRGGAAGTGGGGAAGSAGAGAVTGRGGASGSGGATGRGGAAGGGGAGRGGASGSGGAGRGGISGGAGAAGRGGAAGNASGGGTAGGGAGGDLRGLSWPIDCIPGQTCVGIGYPDVDNDGKAFNCAAPGYPGHEGTDISITAAAMDAGTAVRAAADGTVLFAFDGKYDRCPDATQPDCQDPGTLAAGNTTGTTVCTPLGPYCGTGTGSCFWCFAGGNVIVIRHTGVDAVFATRYDHLRRNSILVRPGDTVRRGQKIAEVGQRGELDRPTSALRGLGNGLLRVDRALGGNLRPEPRPELVGARPSVELTTGAPAPIRC